MWTMLPWNSIFLPQPPRRTDDRRIPRHLIHWVYIMFWSLTFCSNLLKTINTSKLSCLVMFCVYICLHQYRHIRTFMWIHVEARRQQSHVTLLLLFFFLVTQGWSCQVEASKLKRSASLCVFFRVVSGDHQFVCLNWGLPKPDY